MVETYSCYVSMNISRMCLDQSSAVLYMKNYNHHLTDLFGTILYTHQSFLYVKKWKSLSRVQLFATPWTILLTTITFSPKSDVVMGLL